jgi:hypothetical protein
MSSLGLDPSRIDGLPPGVAVRITIDVMETGAMAISGPVYDRQWMLHALEHAVDQVKAFHGPNRPAILTPEYDVGMPELAPKMVA